MLNDSPGDCQTAPPLRPGVPKTNKVSFGVDAVGRFPLRVPNKTRRFLPSCFVLTSTEYISDANGSIIQDDISLQSEEGYGRIDKSRAIGYAPRQS